MGRSASDEISQLRGAEGSANVPGSREAPSLLSSSPVPGSSAGTGGLWCWESAGSAVAIGRSVSGATPVAGTACAGSVCAASVCAGRAAAGPPGTTGSVGSGILCTPGCSIWRCVYTESGVGDNRWAVRSGAAPRAVSGGAGGDADGTLSGSRAGTTAPRIAPAGFPAPSLSGGAASGNEVEIGRSASGGAAGELTDGSGPSVIRCGAGSGVCDERGAGGHDVMGTSSGIRTAGASPRSAGTVPALPSGGRGGATSGSAVSIGRSARGGVTSALVAAEEGASTSCCTGASGLDARSAGGAPALPGNGAPSPRPSWRMVRRFTATGAVRATAAAPGATTGEEGDAGPGAAGERGGAIGGPEGSEGPGNGEAIGGAAEAGLPAAAGPDGTAGGAERTTGAAGRRWIGGPDGTGVTGPPFRDAAGRGAAAGGTGRGGSWSGGDTRSAGPSAAGGNVSAPSVGASIGRPWGAMEGTGGSATGSTGSPATVCATGPAGSAEGTPTGATRGKGMVAAGAATDRETDGISTAGSSRGTRPFGAAWRSGRIGLETGTAGLAPLGAAPAESRPLSWPGSGTGSISRAGAPADCCCT